MSPKPDMHFWQSGMPRAQAQLYLLDLCGSDSQNYTETEAEVTCERCLAALRAGAGPAPIAVPASAPHMTYAEVTQNKTDDAEEALRAETAAHQATRGREERLREALTGLVNDGCLCAVNEREGPCESCGRARAALAEKPEESPGAKANPSSRPCGETREMHEGSLCGCEAEESP